MTAIRPVSTPPPALQTPAGAPASGSAAAAPADVPGAQGGQGIVAESKAMLAVVLQQALAAAAPRQDGLAPLMADAEAMLARHEAALPREVKDALWDLLATRLAPESIDAGKVRQAVRQSGVFLESGLARGQPVAGDLKAALLALRAALQPMLQPMLQAWTGSPATDAAPKMPVLPATAVPQSQGAAPPAGATPAPAAAVPQSASSALPSPQTQPAGPAPQARPDEAVSKADPGATPARAPAAQPQPARPTAGATPAAPGSAAGARPVPSPSPGISPGSGLPAGETPLAATGGGLKAALTLPYQALDSALSGKPAAPSANAPPPPHRHAPTVPQPPVQPGALETMPLREAALRLLGETDAALARHTLLQIASLPDDVAQNRASDPAQRLVFDIPLATPQGTAVMQLRIERDGRRHGKEAKAPVWQATFSLDIEPIGPVHARIAMAGDIANVSLFAERGDSATALRENAGLLAAGLAEAALVPGDILCATGAPASPATAPGLFVDRAS